MLALHLKEGGYGNKNHLSQNKKKVPPYSTPSLYPTL